MGHDLNHFVLFDELHGIADLLLAERDLVVGFQIHIVIHISVFIEILHIFTDDLGLLKLFGRTEGVFDHTINIDTLHLGADKRRALAGLDMLKLDNLIYGTIVLDGHAISEFAGAEKVCHT